MPDPDFLEWARTWIYCGRLGMEDTYRARGILEQELGVEVPFLRSHVVWLLANPGRSLPPQYGIIHLNGDATDDSPSNLQPLPRYRSASRTVREWWQRTRTVQEWFGLGPEPAPRQSKATGRR